MNLEGLLGKLAPKFEIVDEPISDAVRRHEELISKYEVELFGPNHVYFSNWGRTSTYQMALKNIDYAERVKQRCDLLFFGRAIWSEQVDTGIELKSLIAAIRRDDLQLLIPSA